MVQNSILVNLTRKEFITFGGLSKRGEIMGNTLQAKMVVAYMFDHQGDHIFFVMSDWQTWSSLVNMRLLDSQDHIIETHEDVTLELLKHMVEMGDIEEVPSWVQSHSPSLTETKTDGRI